MENIKDFNELCSALSAGCKLLISPNGGGICTDNFSIRKSVSVSILKEYLNHINKAKSFL